MLGLAAIFLLAAMGFFVLAGRKLPTEKTADVGAKETSVAAAELANLSSSSAEPGQAPLLSSGQAAKPAPSLPPPAQRPARQPDPQLASVYDGLVSRMNSGDAEAASQLARGLAYCSQRRDTETNAGNIAKVLDDPNRKDLSPADRANLQANVDAMQEQLAKMGRDPTFCTNLNDQQIDIFLPTALTAAQLGDSNAADCVLGIGRQHVTSPHMALSQYAKTALQIADDEILQGNWIAVRLLSSAYGNYSNQQYLSQLLGRDPLQRYRLLKLEHIGMGFDPNQADPQLAQAAQGLSKEDLATADAWAQDNYQRHFVGKQPLLQGEQPEVCNW